MGNASTCSSSFDVLIVGGGHAGCEAALAAYRAGASVGLLTICTERIAHMSCNPAIGGVGKGHLVREIDALGGAMARVADSTGIQFRRLNTSRGPAVRATRCQSDSVRYREAMRRVLVQSSGLEIIEDEVIAIDVDHGAVKGLMTKNHGALGARAVVITTGTFLNGLCHIGEERFGGGRLGDPPANHLSRSLADLGLSLARFKTGTTPRLAAETINWGVLEEQQGDEPPPRFAFDLVDNPLPQKACHLTATNEQTHEAIRQELHRSPLFSGEIKGIGPRYCPSIEDKVVRFPDKPAHTVFLEPEAIDSDRIYPNGLSTSLPRDVQLKFLQTIKGLERVEIIDPGYAVEYDYAPPTQLDRSLMVKVIKGLFLAGQINGTSGYEEAAAQGLIAGLNAARISQGKAPVFLQRHEAYIGVMIDDLVTKGVDEPYRMFTSRAEHRLTLRESNAEERLLDLGRGWGIVHDERYLAGRNRIELAASTRQYLEKTRVGMDLASTLGLDPLSCAGLKRSDLLRRPEISIDQVLEGETPAAIALVVEEDIKYQGYIKRELAEIERMAELEALTIPPGIRFSRIPGISTEIGGKLETVRPMTLSQASRIPGMTPAALSLIRIAIRTR